MLPANVKRQDSELCEEVSIPIPPAEPLDVGNDPVLITSLDEVNLLEKKMCKKLFFSSKL